jgi:hypothetical protein
LHDRSKEAVMHPQDIDPTLRAAEPAADSLADGFSPPADAEGVQPQAPPSDDAQAALGPQSPF